MYIKSLTVKNLRVFRSCKINFVQPETIAQADGIKNGVGPLRNVSLVLGDNGAGKTSVLRAVALAALAPILHTTGYVPYSMTRRTPGSKPAPADKGSKAAAATAEPTSIEGEFVLHAQDLGEPFQSKVSAIETFEVNLIRRGDNEIIEHQTGPTIHPASQHPPTNLEGYYLDDSPAFLVVGYGATRRTERPENYDSAGRTRKSLRYQRIESLFEDGYTLVPLARWLPRLRQENPGRFKQVVTLIDALLPAPFGFEGSMLKDEYVFTQGKMEIPFQALSDGYRAFIGWVADLMYHICMGAPSGAKLVENRGIVLLDEVDLHLHPAWQREVVSSLSRALPKMQFIITSHSPLVTGAVPVENIIRLELKGNTSKVLPITENSYGKSADQILTSDYFGLDNTRAPEVAAKIQELNRQAIHGNSAASKEMLMIMSGGMPPQGPAKKKA